MPVRRPEVEQEPLAAAPSGAPGAACGKVVVRGNLQGADLVPQGVSMDSEGAGCSRQVAFVLSEGGQQVLPLELFLGRLKRDPLTHQLADDSAKEPVEALFDSRHRL
jgi:hypothetical protein